MAKKTIFIVEDDPDICELIETILKSEGFKVKVFSEAKNLEAQILKLKPGLVIMDLYLPSVDGAAITKTLKSKKETKNLPVVLVSAKNSLEKIASQVKADGFLSKPFNIKDLISVVRKFVK